MELTKVKGNTYYISAPTNIGVYAFKNKNCMIIDTGINAGQAKRIDEVLLQNKLHPKYIFNTHGHKDHCGGNLYFKENYSGCHVYTSQGEKLFMENPSMQPAILFSSAPISKLKVSAASTVDFILEEGISKISDEKFEFISLKGHSLDQVGIITPEKVCFVGDAVFSAETIEKYGLPYIYKLEDYVHSLEKIKNVDAEIYIIGHSKKLYSKEEMIELADLNIQNVEKFKEQILELLDQPFTREEVLENIAVLNGLNMGFRQYHLNFSAISAFIAYLYEKNLIDCSNEDGKLYYFKKP